MSEKNIPKSDSPNIGNNTRWDSPSADPNAGATVPKPSTSLKPKDSNSKK